VWRRALLGAALAALCGCSNDWRTDMWYQPAVRPESGPRPEPTNSVPLGAGAFLPDRDAAESLRNPVPATAASLARGQALFEQRCSACHGAAGHGNGPVSKFFPAAPDLAYATVKARSDGYLFGTITFGGRAMPFQGDGLTARDRWDLVNWVRHVQAAAAGESR
jgi:mono/diheme cytochrome c family protein